MPTVSLTPDEKLHAALAHGSVIFSFFGPIGPVIVWLLQRRKSKYASFHALQAMGFQVITFWLWILCSVLLPLVFLIFFVGGMVALEDTNHFEYFPLVFQGTFFALIFGLWGIYILVGMVGAGFCLAGKDFHYPLIGKWLEKYLNSESQLETELNSAHEDAWVSAMCHAAAIFFLWGIASPIIVWFSQKDRSKHLAFQAAQAAVYQGIAIVAYFIGMAFYMLLIFGIMAIAIGGGALTADMNSAVPPWVGIAFVAFFILLALFWLIGFIATPIYYIISIVGAIRILRGHDFRYPIIGRIVALRMNYSSELTKIQTEA